MLSSFLSTNKRLIKRVTIGVCIGAVGIVAYSLVTRPTFTSEFPKGTGLTVGTYRYELNLTTEKATDVNASVTDLTGEDVDKANKKKEETLISDNFNSTWTSAEGVQVGRSKTEPYAKVVLEGYTKSVEPFTSMGSMYLTVENGGDGVLLFKYTAKDDVLYIDFSETRSSLLNSGNGSLIEVGSSLPEIRSLRLEKEDMCEFLGVEDDDAEFSYKGLSSAVKLFWVDVMKELKKSDKFFNRSIADYTGDKHYISISDSNKSKDMSSLYSVFFDRDFYENYASELESKSMISDLQYCRMLGNSLYLNSEVFLPASASLPYSDLVDYGATSSDWVRINNGVYEVGLDLSWKQPSKPYSCNLSLEGRKVSAPKKVPEIVVPNVSTSYADFKEKYHVSMTRIVKLLLQCTTGIGETSIESSVDN